MRELVLLVMLVAATLYAVLAGADFGAGLVEPFVRAEDRKRVEVAIAPVWEANHVWLVLLATLAFVGFPTLYSTATTYLHIPLVLVLLGIVARGSAFTFRHYDPTPGAYEGWYTLLFRAGSLLTPLFLGITIAATAAGRISSDESLGFYALYVAPWNTWFTWSTGLFVTALFAFEGAALLAAENPGIRSSGRLPFLRIARIAHAATMVLGGLTLLAAYLEHLTWFDELLHSWSALALMVVATLLIAPIAWGFVHGHPWLVRLSTGAQAACILLGFFAAQYPVLLRMSPHDVTLDSAAAPAATFRVLLIAVVVGLSLILPSTAYLIRVYKR
ncbi:MAG TPA: cytochrome d ubiquinol oxidase subunit II [Polyangiales bacterium]|nr:cytochrome d ubiquinol oxidase subunit II [Polyangiales bacterium]